MSYPKGRPCAEETKRKLSIALKGRDCVPRDSRLRIAEANRRPKTPQHCANMSKARKGYRHPKEIQDKINATKRNTLRGKGNPNWKGGVTSLYILIRTSYEALMWKKNVYQKDDYTCQKCNRRGGRLDAHHRKPFAKLLREFLSMYSELNPTDNKEILSRLAITHKPFWEVDNGETLCKDCHPCSHRGRDSGLRAI